MNKIKVLGRPVTARLDESDLDGKSINEVIAMLQDIANSNDGDALKFKWDVHDKWDDVYSLELMEYRLETDDEYHVRIAAEKIQKERSEEYDRRMFERLRAKYEQKN